MRRLPSVGMLNRCIRHQTCAVINPKKGEELIGGDRWHIIHYSHMTEKMTGAIEGKGHIVLPKVDATMAVFNGSRKVMLMDVDKAWGKQCLLLKGGTVVSLKFNGLIMIFDLRLPIPEELMILKISTSGSGDKENLPEEEVLTNPVIKLKKIGSDQN
eukprot:10954730-Ditylum_brightwellii.AAC.1